MRFKPPSQTVHRINPETGKFEEVERDPDGYNNALTVDVLPGSAAADAGRLSPAARKVLGLGYDPIVELVAQHRHLMEEIRTLQNIRDGSLVRLDKDGKEEKYSRMHYVELMTLAQKISADLLRYRYARVPEMGDFLRAAPMVMKVQLTSSDEEFTIGQEPDVIDGDIVRDGG